MRALPAIACLACLTPLGAGAQTPSPAARVEYDEATDSTTRSLSAYALIDTSRTPHDTLALELSQRWKGRMTPAPVAPVELGLGRTSASGLPPGRLPLNARGRNAIVFVIDGARRVRIEQDQYVSSAGARPTFETARYRVMPADLRLIAESRDLRVRVGDRELWIDPAWRRVVADLLAAQRER